MNSQPEQNENRFIGFSWNSILVFIVIVALIIAVWILNERQNGNPPYDALVAIILLIIESVRANLNFYQSRLEKHEAQRDINLIIGEVQNQSIKMIDTVDSVKETVSQQSQKLSEQIEQQAAEDRQEFQKLLQEHRLQLKELARQLGENAITAEKEKLKIQLLDCTIRFREQFAVTKTIEQVKVLSNIGTELLNLFARAEALIQEDFHDESHQLRAAFFELNFAIHRSTSGALAPQATVEAWHDRIYGNRNSELFKIVRSTVEALKFRLKQTDEDNKNI